MKKWMLTTSLFLAGCTTDVGQPTFQQALNATVQDAEVLTKACGRDIPEMDAKQAPFATKWSDFTSSRGVFADDGTGSVAFVYTPKSGAPCAGKLSFSFHQDTAMKKFSRRNIAYSSVIELKDVTVSAKD